MVGRTDYEERKENRINRLQTKAAEAGSEARAQFKRAQDIGKCIPMGQPILVGHHSEAHARADARRIDTAMRKSIEAQNEAADYAAKAEAASRNRAISGDNPDAVKVEEVEKNGTTILELSVAPDDMGKVIGKQGRIARAIRAVVKASAIHTDKRVTVEIVQ
jgi:predicted RNA-binding protein YlqC (UPF0109 family)